MVIFTKHSAVGSTQAARPPPTLQHLHPQYLRLRNYEGGYGENRSWPQYRQASNTCSNSNNSVFSPFVIANGTPRSSSVNALFLSSASGRRPSGVSTTAHSTDYLLLKGSLELGAHCNVWQLRTPSFLGHRRCLFASFLTGLAERVCESISSQIGARSVTVLALWALTPSRDFTPSPAIVLALGAVIHQRPHCLATGYR
jgi:hypothetical protein